MTNVHAPFEAQLINISDIAANTRCFRFEIINRELSFLPGQFFLLQVDPKTHRSYSLASSPAELPFFDLIIKFLDGGQASEMLWAAQVSDIITFRGPMGRFGINSPHKDQIFIATGTGLAPIRSFWRHLSRLQNPPKMELYFGVRHQENLFCLDEFDQVSREVSGNFHHQTCLSKPQGIANDDIHFSGRVTDLIRQKPAAELLGKEISICGSKQMVQEISEILLAAGVQKADINVESW